MDRQRVLPHGGHAVRHTPTLPEIFSIQHHNTWGDVVSTTARYDRHRTQIFCPAIDRTITPTTHCIASATPPPIPRVDRPAHHPQPCAPEDEERSHCHPPRCSPHSSRPRVPTAAHSLARHPPRLPKRRHRFVCSHQPPTSPPAGLAAEVHAHQRRQRLARCSHWRQPRVTCQQPHKLPARLVCCTRRRHDHMSSPGSNMPPQPPPSPQTAAPPSAP